MEPLGPRLSPLRPDLAGIEPLADLVQRVTRECGRGVTAIRRPRPLA